MRTGHRSGLRFIWVAACLPVAGALVGCGTNEADEATEEIQDPILKGTPVTQNDNGVVAIYAGNDMNCTGTHMGNRWVITARHCVYETDDPTTPRPASSLWVTSFLKPGAVKPMPTWTVSGAASGVASYVVYDATVDVAMLRLSKALTGKYGKSPVGLAGQRVAGELLLCQGYGRDATGIFFGVGKLLEAEMRVKAVGVHSPNEIEPRNDWPHQFSLARNSLGQTTYYADSGGPCFTRLGGGGVTLASIHKTGFPLTNPTTAYDVSTGSNTPWHSWIMNNLRSP